jgi:hypothetical protein
VRDAARDQPDGRLLSELSWSVHTNIRTDQIRHSGTFGSPTLSPYKAIISNALIRSCSWTTSRRRTQRRRGHTDVLRKEMDQQSDELLVQKNEGSLYARTCFGAISAVRRQLDRVVSESISPYLATSSERGLPRGSLVPRNNRLPTSAPTARQSFGCTLRHASIKDANFARAALGFAHSPQGNSYFQDLETALETRVPQPTMRLPSFRGTTEPSVNCFN